jgi:hypothetical protein
MNGKSKHVWRRLVLTSVAIAGFLAVLHVARNSKNVAARDSIQYWAAGRLLVHRQNPYDHERVFQLERQQGYSESRPVVLRNPPWSLFMVAPLGLLSPFWAWFAWVAISFGSLVLGMRLCRKLYGGNSPRNLFSVVGYMFAPVLACLASGQMGLVLMLGVVLFLAWESNHPFLAGAALILPFAKPHLLSLFFLTVLFWTIIRRRREIAAGFLVAFAIALVLGLLLDPNAFRHYREMLHTAAIGEEFIPSLSGVIRLLFFHRTFWVQFVPMAAGLVWCTWFFFRRQHNWSWQQQGPMLLVASVLTAPYGWLPDESLLLPALLQAAAFAYDARAAMTYRIKAGLVVCAFLNAVLLLMVGAGVPLWSGAYFWSSLLWFFGYCWGRTLMRSDGAAAAKDKVAASLSARSGSGQ